MAESKQVWEVAVYDPKVKQSFIELVGEKAYLREIILAYQIVKGSEPLQKCSVESIRSAIINVALVGATLNPGLQQAFLVPRKGKACLDLSFRGLVRIATESGGVTDIDATVVHEQDQFYYEQGMDPVLKHIPSLEDDPGRFKFVYAIATLPGGMKKFIVLNEKEIEKVKATSAAKQGPWIEWYEEMARKTAVKKLFKLLPSNEKMAQAVSVINEHEGLVAKDEAKAKDIMKRFDLGPKDEPKADDLIACPDAAAMVAASQCVECTKRKGCPALN